VADGETKAEVDEVIVTKFETEDDDHWNGMLPHHSSEILDTDVDEEIELFLKQGLVSEQDVSEHEVTQKRSTNEKVATPQTRIMGMWRRSFRRVWWRYVE
jgi:hypothetical protein